MENPLGKADRKRLQKYVDSNPDVESINEQIRLVSTKLDDLRDSQTLSGVSFTENELSELYSLRLHKMALEEELRIKSDLLKADFESENKKLTA